MSQAFVKESDEQWLHEVQPTLSALQMYLSHENNGIRVNMIKNEMKSGREIFHMSNGLAYGKDANGMWEIV